MITLDKPQHVHDGDTCCIFLGRAGDLDMWVCPTEPCVIVRKSDEGSDYYSYGSWSWADLTKSRDSRPHEAARECRDRALARGLITQPTWLCYKCESIMNDWFCSRCGIYGDSLYTERVEKVDENRYTKDNWTWVVDATGNVLETIYSDDEVSA